MSCRSAMGGAVRAFVPVVVLLLGVAVARGGVAMEVRRDMGGPVAARMEAIRQMERGQVAVRISGVCVSACTLYLGLSTACVMPGARLGFHGPTSPLPGVPLPRETFERVSHQMAGHYPPAIRAWFLSEARLVTGGYLTLSGAEAIRLGARPCARSGGAGP